MDDVTAFLMDAGTPSLSFKDAPVGTVKGGKILAAEVAQQTDYDNNEPLFWDDGKPRMQLVVTLATDERNPEIDSDDGTRKDYVKSQALKALRDAVKAAGLSQLPVGGDYRRKFTGEGEAKSAKLSPPKLYAFKITPPSVDLDDFGTPAPAADVPSEEDF